MKNILFLGPTLFVDEHKKYVAVNNIYYPIPKLLRLFRKIWFDYNLPFKKIWLNKSFFSDIQDHQTIILSATQYNVRISKLIDTLKISNKRFIFWYWNPVANIVSPSNISKSWEIWSFDKVDSTTYNIKYNNTYYYKLKPTIEKLSNTFDVFFVGQDKQRIREILKLGTIFDANNISYNFHIVKDATSNLDYNYKQKLSYDQVLDVVRKSVALLDFVQEGQTGLTLRIMEAMFFSKKIITNNHSIVNYDFYCSQNIFILGIDDLKDLKYFLESDYRTIAENIVQQYTIPQWLKNFN